VGEGTLKDECVKYTKKNQLKEVYFEGQKTGLEARRYFSTCDIYCSPAIFGESFGIVLLEAMAVGKPVCGYANPGYKELLSGTKGEQFLAEPKNVPQLTEKLEMLIKDEKLRQEMSQWGLETVKQYEWRNVADRVLNFYDICLKAKLEKNKN
jgi:phosphatidylinositol alpha-mannosyltransferase